MLRQISLNLVSNAIKFTSKGGVNFSAGYDPDDMSVYIKVNDTGLGLSSKDAKKIFEPFRQVESSYTKRYAGTGLGLAITKKQVELLSGRIRVRSKLGKGSEFSVMIPVQLERSDSGVMRAISKVAQKEPISAEI